MSDTVSSLHYLTFSVFIICSLGNLPAFNQACAVWKWKTCDGTYVSELLEKIGEQPLSITEALIGQLQMCLPETAAWMSLIVIKGIQYTKYFEVQNTIHVLLFISVHVLYIALFYLCVIIF